MVMVIGQPVNSWGGGHAGTPGASRAAGCLANISTLHLLGQESGPLAAAVVSCESPVSPSPTPLQQSANAACESGVKAERESPQEPFVQRTGACIECGRRVMSPINRPESKTVRF